MGHRITEARPHEGVWLVTLSQSDQHRYRDLLGGPAARERAVISWSASMPRTRQHGTYVVTLEADGTRFQVQRSAMQPWLDKRQGERQS